MLYSTPGGADPSQVSARSSLLPASPNPCEPVLNGHQFEFRGEIATCPSNGQVYGFGEYAPAGTGIIWDYWQVSNEYSAYAAMGLLRGAHRH